MFVKKMRLNGAVLGALSAMGLGLGMIANQAKAAVVTYNLDVNGATTGFGIVTGSTYDWDSTTNGGFWSNNSTSTTGNIATNGWVQGNFPKFQPATPAPTYTITVSNDEQVTGVFFSTAQTVVVNPIGPGTLEAINTIAPSPPTIATADGFLGSTNADVTFNVPISGAGIIQPSNGGNLRFNAVNTYTGGTNLSSTATLVHFNNSSSFGTGFINMGVAGFSPLLGSGGAPLTLPNNFTTTVTGGGVNFAADANTPVNSTGTWVLAKTICPRNNAGSTSPVTLSNVISGTAGVALSTNTAGSVIIFSGANQYTGPTTITGAGGTGAGTSNIRLQLGAANTIASSTSVILAGGILDPGGFNHTMSATTLALATSTGASTIDYVAGSSEVDFANSSAVAWTASKVLNLANWNPSIDKLRFGTDATGLTSTQLAEIEANGSASSLGTAFLDANGYVNVPEPTTAALLVGASMLLAARRRKV